LTTNNALLSKINGADLLLAHRKGSWTFEVLSALRETSGADVHISTTMSRSKISMSDSEPLCGASKPFKDGQIWTKSIHMIHSFPAGS